MKKSKILKDAKKTLLTKGWIKGTFVTEKGCCALGAVYGGAYPYPTDSVQERWDAGDILQQFCNALHNSGIGTFNDRRTTTLNDVLELMDIAIINLEAVGE